MQTYFLRKSLLKFLAVSFAVLALSAAGAAQTLARPGWAGSGLAAEPWWRNAVLYRIAPASFQDSDGDGTGDLRGVADRMDYLQTLGVDAVVLDPPTVGKDGAPEKDIDAQFEDLISAASQHHVRVVMTLEDGGNSQALPDGTVLALARMWLTRGAAGVLLRSGQSAEAAAPLLRRLRALTDSFPGDRVLLAATATNPAPSTVPTISAGDTQSKSKAAGGKRPAGAQLTEVPLELTNATAKTIRAALNGVNGAAGQGGLFLEEELFSADALLDPAHVASLDGRRRAFALALLASRGGALLHFGQEIGMLPTTASAADKTALMQWTPSNVTPEAKVEAPPVVSKPEPAPTPAATGSSEEYGAFRPYVPPPKPAAPAAKPGQTEVALTPTVDPDTLPGFTSGTLPAAPAPLDAKRINVAAEDGDPDSLLNLYRRLIQLHHDNPTLHGGTETLLDYDDLGAVVWVRQPPKGSTTTTAIVAVCNLSGTPLRLSLNQELTRQHVHVGSLRNLLSTQASQFSVQSTDNLSLPPYGVFLGELYH
jgi:alpha-glucosidase